MISGGGMDNLYTCRGLKHYFNSKTPRGVAIMTVGAWIVFAYGIKGLSRAFQISHERKEAKRMRDKVRRVLT